MWDFRAAFINFLGKYSMATYVYLTPYDPMSIKHSRVGYEFKMIQIGHSPLRYLKDPVDFLLLVES